MKRIVFTTFLMFTFCFAAFAQKLEEKNEAISPAGLKTKIKGFNGKTFHLADSKAKCTVVLLWASWSNPGSLAFKDFGKINAEFNKNGIKIFGLSVDEKKRDQKRAKYFARKLKIKFDSGFADRDLLRSFELTSIPTIWLLSPNGEILNKIIGYNRVTTIVELKKQLNEEFSTNLKIPVTKNKKSSELIISGKY